MTKINPSDASLLALLAENPGARMLAKKPKSSRARRIAGLMIGCNGGSKKDREAASSILRWAAVNRGLQNVGTS